MKVGGPKDLTDAVKAAGGEVGPRSIWLGAWVIKGGYAQYPTFFQACKTDGVVPLAFHWWFGDDSSPTAIQNGVMDRYQNVWKTGDMGVEAARKVAAMAQTAGVAPIFVVEHEMTKNGVTENAASFNAYFSKVADAVKAACPAARICICPGVWADMATVARNFAPAIAKSDLLGLQTLLFAPRHPVEQFRMAGPTLATKFKTLRGASTKPAALVDVGFSSYGGAYSKTHPFAGGDGRANETLQVEALRSIAIAAPGMGLEFMVYRALRDAPNFDVANFGGEAEKYVGVRRADGSNKPALPILLGMAVPTAPPSPAVPTYSEAQMAEMHQRVQVAEAQLALARAEAAALAKRIADAKAALG